LAFLLWIQPYVIGMMIYYLFAHRWLKAAYLLLVFIVSLIVSSSVVSMGLQSKGFETTDEMLRISGWVMLAQAIIWLIVLLLTMYKSIRDTENRVLLAGALPGLLLSVLFAFQANNSSPQMLEVAREEAAKAPKIEVARSEEQLRLDRVGFKPYPSTGPLFADYKVRFSDEKGQSLILKFSTMDEPGKVIDFYRDCAERAGLNVSHGVKLDTQTIPGIERMFGAPSHLVTGNDSVLLATGEDHVALEVCPQIQPGVWMVQVWWDTTDKFDEYVEETYDLF
jgi:hypothetical protein